MVCLWQCVMMCVCVSVQARGCQWLGVRWTCTFHPHHRMLIHTQTHILGLFMLKSCKHWNSSPNFAYRFFRAYSTRFEWSKLSLSTFAPLSDHIYLPLKMTRIIEINSLSNILPNNTTKQNLLWLLIWFYISTWKNIFWSAKKLRVVSL